MTQVRHVCPGCGSVAVSRTPEGWSCDRCGKIARAFPEAHRELDRGPDALGPVRDRAPGGYQRRRTPLDE